MKTLADDNRWRVEERRSEEARHACVLKSGVLFILRSRRTFISLSLSLSIPPSPSSLFFFFFFKCLLLTSVSPPSLLLRLAFESFRIIALRRSPPPGAYQASAAICAHTACPDNTAKCLQPHMETRSHTHALLFQGKWGSCRTAGPITWGERLTAHLSVAPQVRGLPSLPPFHSH